MDFFTKNQLREMIEEYIEGIPDNSRIMISYDYDKGIIHIGNTIERTISEYQTFLVHQNTYDTLNQDIEIDTDKDIRQGAFKPKYRKFYGIR